MQPTHLLALKQQNTSWFFTMKHAVARPMLALMVLTLASLTTFTIAPNVHAEQNSQQQVESLSEAELAQALAPIALYPDSLLTHILIASTYPLEVVQAHRWSKKHDQLETQAKMDLAEKQSWDPSVIALTAFPTVLEKLSDDLEWTQNLGDAFLEDEETVLAMVQTLRHEADDANSLDDMENMKVTKVEKQIIIEPAQPEIVYVPYYDTRVVYGGWRWHAYPPVYWYTRPVYGFHRPIFWGPRVHISFNYFFGSVHWSHRRIVVINHRHSHYYKAPRKIAYSSGAQRWKHKPAHRHGVAYRNKAVSKRYNTPNRHKHQITRDVQRDHNKHNLSTQVRPVNKGLHQSPKDKSRDKSNYSNNRMAPNKPSVSKPDRVSSDRARPDRSKELTKPSNNTRPVQSHLQRDVHNNNRQRDMQNNRMSNGQNKSYDRAAISRPSVNKPSNHARSTNQVRHSSHARPSNTVRQPQQRMTPTRSSHSNNARSRGIER
ncbi:DUF3300 domain-containing protein [Shewanella gaetbuli]